MLIISCTDFSYSSPITKFASALTAPDEPVEVLLTGVGSGIVCVGCTAAGAVGVEIGTLDADVVAATFVDVDEAVEDEVLDADCVAVFD